MHLNPTTARHTKLLGRAVVLGLLTSVGSFAIDMYLPGFAAIARDLHTDPGTVQYTMSAYLVALCLGQMLYGPLSDAYGRKRPLYLGLAVFLIGSAACYVAPDIDTLIAARFIEGLGAAATTVIPLAIIRDEHIGPDAAQLMSLTSLSRSVSPMLAPTFGGVLVQTLSWRMIFAVLIAISLAASAMTERLLPETLPPSRRMHAGPAGLALACVSLVSDRRFIVPLVTAGFAQCVVMLFIAGSPAVFVGLHHLSPVSYGGLFALHAAVLIVVSQFNAPMMRRFSLSQLTGTATLVFAASAMLLAVLVLCGMTVLWPFVLLTLLLFACVGIFSPPTFIAAMEPFQEIAGAAAAFGVAIQFAMCAAVVFLQAAMADGTARPMVVLIAVSTCAALGVWRSRRKEESSFLKKRSKRLLCLR